MKKFISIAIFLTAFYVLPLLGQFELLWNPRIIVLAIVCFLLLFTQPRLSVDESKKKSSSDKNTVWLIMIGGVLFQIISILEWRFFQEAAHVWTWNFFTVGGLVLMLGGLIFRNIAIKQLGNFFSAVVQIKDGHQLIQTGLYKYLRHPSYTGAWLTMIGVGVFLHSYAGIALFGIGMLFIYQLRIRAEETTLRNQFKETYDNYRLSTWKMIPFLY